jgi:hypothetical protein
MLLILGLLFLFQPLAARAELPHKGLAIASPPPKQLERFITFVETHLAPAGLNLLVLRVDYDFEYTSHPELRSENPLSREQVGKLVAMGQRHGIRIIPQFNLLGHQSWASEEGLLLQKYPEFDETPHVKMPEEYAWPNEDGLYCKSYCPLHPEVHGVVFALVDELVAAFEADAFHAGMDEVFYIADEKCPRCSGKDPAQLFADEVTRIRDHLAKTGVELWIWGDRLIDGVTTGIGEWEAAINDTHRAIDLIPRDVVINDWHYERAEPTAALFSIKGLRVLSASWHKPEVALEQQRQALTFRAHSHPDLAERHLGVMHTWWSGAERFMDLYEGKGLDGADEKALGAIAANKALFPDSGQHD